MGYWGIPMERENRYFTSFEMHRGKYRFKVMPYGLKNASTSFQLSINADLLEFEAYACAYIDNIAVFTTD